MGVAGQGVHGREPVQRPGQPARPRRVVAPALLSGLAQKLAGIKIEDAFMAGRPVAAYQILAGRLAVLLGNVDQMLIIGLQPCHGNDADVHHDVDEDRIRRQEGTQKPARGVEPGGHSLATLNDHLPAGVVPGELPPLLPRRAQYETKIVNLIVVLTLLDELAVPLGAGPPVLAESQLIEQPHLAAQETFAPVGPGFLAMLPAALVGVEREVIGIVPSQPRHLAGGDLEGSVGGCLRLISERQIAAFAHSCGRPST